MSETLLLEIGCEEVPARMIPAAAADLAARVVGILDQAGLTHGAATAWGGTRRLAVRVDGVQASQESRDETVYGPPASAAFAGDGTLTPAGAGFARKQGIDPAALERVATDRGIYAGFRRRVEGRSVGAVLGAALPQAVASMSFPKTMRWAQGVHRWVRPVHLIVALHGADVLPIEIFGVRAGRVSEGHRFLAKGPVTIPHADAYEGSLEAAFVVADPARRRELLRRRLESAAAAVGGALVADEALLDEAVDLVEWPGVVTGTFDEEFLALPSEILVTTLRHHQKSFSVTRPGGLASIFLSVANTDRDPAGHIRRGNEWVVSGRLEDARFFWGEDRKRRLDDRLDDLAKVTFHVKVGTYGDKAAAIEKLADRIALHIGINAETRPIVCAAARLSKCDLVTGLVGEFPELQGVVGGLLLRAEGADPRIADGVAEHYRPASAEDRTPGSEVASIVSIADRLHTIKSLLAAGQVPTGSRDPFGLRRAAFGVFRILRDRKWSIALQDLFGFSDQTDAVYAFLVERLIGYLKDLGYSPNEIEAVRKPRISDTEFDTWPIHEIIVKLDAVKTLRGRSEFDRLVDLTKRVDNIIGKAHEIIVGITDDELAKLQPESHEAARNLESVHQQLFVRIRSASQRHDWTTLVSTLSLYTEPVATFFDQVLVLDPTDVGSTWRRTELLTQVRTALTHDFDIRELAGQADRRG